MYLTFYGLKKQPFHITPDPEFLYLSPSHKEALAAIIYGIEQRKGFVTVTGAVGVGKTTILRSYLETAETKRLKIIYIFNPKLTFEGLLKTVYQELNLPIESNDPVEMVNRLYEVLIEEYKQENTIVLVVDEAQNMPIDTLESLRMISNLETSRDKLIQIVLVGQLEFEEKLNLDRLRQLKQRLAVRSRILPLTKDESLEYVKFRLQKAGTPSSMVFTTPALKKIVRKAQGIPRVLNVFCDNALITGFGYQKKPVTKKIVKEIIGDFESKGRPHFVRRQLPRVAALALLLLLLGIAWLLPLKRVLLDHMPMFVPRKQVGKVDAVRGVGPMENTAAKEQEVPASGEPEASPHKDKPVLAEALVGADALSKKGGGAEPTGESFGKKPTTGPTAEHSLVRDSNGKVRGLWLLDPADAQDRRLIMALLSKNGLPAATLLKHGYRVVPNKHDNAGGSFVMFGSSTAPGEAVAAIQDDATPAHREPVRINQEDATTHYNMGVALYKKGLLDEAIQAYREALRINPEDATTHYNMGVALYKKGLLDEAIQAYREALRINPEYANAHTNLGLSLYKKGLLDEAIQAYREALRINPEYALAYLNLGLALKDKGLDIQAVTAFENFIKYAPPPYAGEVEQVRELADSLKGNGKAKE
jgi:type II secretory pathway predicted ATPase ExeA/tetratricopeptide (TPR) repeat protein